MLCLTVIAIDQREYFFLPFFLFLPALEWGSYVIANTSCTRIHATTFLGKVPLQNANTTRVAVHHALFGSLTSKSRRLSLGIS